MPWQKLLPMVSSKFTFFMNIEFKLNSINFLAITPVTSANASPVTGRASVSQNENYDNANVEVNLF